MVWKTLPMSERWMGQGWLAAHLCLSGGLGLWGVFPRGDGGGSGSRGIPHIHFTIVFVGSSSATLQA